MFHVPSNPNKLNSVMGNVLDSDSSAAGSDVENEAEPGVNVKVPVPEVRTDGDGMECTGKNSLAHKDALFSGCNHNSSSTTDSHPHKQFVQPFIPNNAIQIINQKISKVPFSEPEPPIPWTAPSTLQIRSAAPCVESPKELPPRNQLIHLKPIKKLQPPSASNNVPSASYTQFTNAPVVKQKDPKFVPYEPYKGAVRPMTDDDTGKTHSRKPSSTSSIVSASCPPSCPPTLSESRSATNIGGSPKKESSEDSPTHSNRNATLLKERLKMAEKDIVDLQTENTRLKRLFVDSMAGPPNPTQTVSDSTNSPITAESFDNLSDEIEVWRSKFLSTCVLVEQLTKENQALKDASTTAVELFREIKSDTVLTPVVFDKINAWTQQYEQRRSQAHRESFSSYNEDDEALRF